MRDERCSWCDAALSLLPAARGVATTRRGDGATAAPQPKSQTAEVRVAWRRDAEGTHRLLYHASRVLSQNRVLSHSNQLPGRSSGMQLSSLRDVRKGARTCAHAPYPPEPYPAVDTRAVQPPTTYSAVEDASHITYTLVPTIHAYSSPAVVTQTRRSS